MASNDPAKLEQQIVALRSEIDEITAAPIDVDTFVDRVIRPALKVRLENFAKRALTEFPRPWKARRISCAAFLLRTCSSRPAVNSSRKI